MSKKSQKVAGRTIAEWEALSAELDEEMSTAPENTEPLSAEEMSWYRRAVMDTGPKVKVTMRLRQWQIERAKQLAKEKGLRGYQTLLDQIISEALLP